MKYKKSHISIEDTHAFSKLVEDYIHQDEKLKSLITSFPSKDSVLSQIQIKKKQHLDRRLLKEVISSQYEGMKLGDSVQHHLDLLSEDSTFTICTAHQPVIFTGHLYFIYKTVHAIKLALELSASLPMYRFVPVFFIGSEDNDLDEIGELNINGKQLQWQAHQTGSCGRMLSTGFDELLAEVGLLLNKEIPGEKKLYELFCSAYDGKNTISHATRMILHALFGEYGLLVLDGDDIRLKQKFATVLSNELFQQRSYEIVTESLTALSQNYKIQASPREINLFYLKNGLRERIERKDLVWKVLNTQIEFTKEELEAEVAGHPDRFSPNVILRPLYQEIIMPNVTFIGGGGEIAYWIPLGKLFAYYDIPFPLLQLRNSLLWITSKSSAKMKSLSLSNHDIFSSLEDLLQKRIAGQEALIELKKMQEEQYALREHVEHLGATISKNLSETIKAHHAKMMRIDKRIQEKFVNHLKRNETDFAQHFTGLKAHLFPQEKLQERYENYITLYKIIGDSFIPLLLESIEGFGNELIVMTEE